MSTPWIPFESYTVGKMVLRAAVKKKKIKTELLENFSCHRWVIGTFSKFCLGIQVLAHSQKTVDVWSFQLSFQKIKRSLWDKFAICRSPNWRLQERFIKDLSTWIMMVVVGAQLYVIPGCSQTEDPISAKPVYSCVSIFTDLCAAAESSQPALGSC